AALTPSAPRAPHLPMSIGHARTLLLWEQIQSRRARRLHIAALGWASVPERPPERTTIRPPCPVAANVAVLAFDGAAASLQDRFPQVGSEQTHGSRTRQRGTERGGGVNLPLLRSCPGFRDRASLRSDRRGRHWGRRRLVVFVADARRRDHDRRGIRTVRGD